MTKLHTTSCHDLGQVSRTSAAAGRPFVILCNHHAKHIAQQSHRRLQGCLKARNCPPSRIILGSCRIDPLSCLHLDGLRLFRIPGMLKNSIIGDIGV